MLKYLLIFYTVVIFHDWNKWEKNPQLNFLVKILAYSTYFFQKKNWKKKIITEHLRLYFPSSSKKHEDPTVPQDVEDVTVGEDTWSSVAVEVIEDNHERSDVASSENNSAEVDVKISSMVVATDDFSCNCVPLTKSIKI